MTVPKLQGRGKSAGRGSDQVLAQSTTPRRRTRSPFFENQQPLLLTDNQSHGHMAPSFRRNNLVCFYCNKKSGIKYDGLISRWDCPQCESTNFLDENGEITDPPVATESAAPGLLRYTTTPARSPFRDEDSQLFCATCVKNQHLYTASLAQYHVETDSSHPRYKDMEREYFTYRKSLERLYPQVCEDCEPKVLARMRDAGRTAKADHLRRAMDKSRSRRFNSGPKISFSGTIEVIGKCLWYAGLTGQLLWSVLALSVPINWPGFMLGLSSTETSNALQHAHSLAWIGLGCSIASIWWNPMFKQMNKGFMSHVSGFGDWYKLQLLSILVRLIFHNTVGPSIFADPFFPLSIGANVFIVIFTSMLAVMSHHSLKVDLTPLWTATPEKLSHVGPKSRDSPKGVESMADILDQMVATPSRTSKNRIASSAPSFDLQITKKTRNGGDLSSLSLTPRRNNVDQSRVGPSLLDISANESAGYMASPLQIQQRQESTNDSEEMEWTPTESQSQHRAFNYPQSSQRTSESFGRAPLVEQPSPFWYKVPPAPITPAQKLRNPPNRPALRVSSQEVKENFFNRVTHRLPASNSQGRQSTLAKKENTHSEVAFAQQKFFPPPLPNEAGNSLADLLTGFSLGGSENETLDQRVEQRSRKRYGIQSLVLLLGFALWNHTVYHPTEHSQNLMLVVMLACIGLSIRHVLDTTILISDKSNSLIRSVGAIISSLEWAAAVYLLVEVIAGRGHGGNCASLGTILTGEMFAHGVLVTLMSS